MCVFHGQVVSSRFLRLISIISSSGFWSLILFSIFYWKRRSTQGLIRALPTGRIRFPVVVVVHSYPSDPIIKPLKTANLQKLSALRTHTLVKSGVLTRRRTGIFLTWRARRMYKFKTLLSSVFFTHIFADHWLSATFKWNPNVLLLEIFIWATDETTTCYNIWRLWCVANVTDTRTGNSYDCNNILNCEGKNKSTRIMYLFKWSCAYGQLISHRPCFV